MNSSKSLWIFACLVTVFAAYVQRVTGPTYPVRGTMNFEGTKLQYDLPRSHDTGSPANLRVITADTIVRGIVEWKRYKVEENWRRVTMSYEGGGLRAELPSQPPAGKLQYRLILARADEVAVVPSEDSIIIRFKGEVPAAILIAHIIAMFLAMLLAARAGLEYFGDGTKLRSLIYWTLALTVVGGFVLGPIVQYYAFNAWWTGWPSGTDLTDNKTGFMLIAWVGAFVAMRRSKRPGFWSLIAAIVTFVVFLIPHSLFGSELIQNSLGQPTTTTDSVRTK